MNIFYVSKYPVEAAQSLVDSHVVKMILESAQMLSTAHRVVDGRNLALPDRREQILYKATHINHPSNVWCRESATNYYWLFAHYRALCIEYTYRYDKFHKSQSLEELLIFAPKFLRKFEGTPIPCCMDEKYIISSDPVVNYRNYYNIAKKDLHKWKKREKPNWIL